MQVFLCGRFFTFKMDVVHSSEMSVHVQTTWHYIPENCSAQFDSDATMLTTSLISFIDFFCQIPFIVIRIFWRICPILMSFFYESLCWWIVRHRLQELSIIIWLFIFQFLLQPMDVQCGHTLWKDTLQENLLNSIQFNSLLFMCQVNSHKANYRHSTVQIYITT
jgi:hypothetical protein